MRSVCLDCGSFEAPTATTIDQIARLKLAARRFGCELELANANSSLLELIAFTGLSDVLGVESGRETEKRKYPGCVEEEGEFGDPTLR